MADVLDAAFSHRTTVADCVGTETEARRRIGGTLCLVSLALSSTYLCESPASALPESARTLLLSSAVTKKS